MPVSKLLYRLDEFYVYTSVPEKVLLAAVLEMAVRDLLYSSSYDLKKQVINWILYDGKKKSNFPVFSFQDCVDYLELSGAQINLLIDTAIQGFQRGYKIN